MANFRRNDKKIVKIVDKGGFKPLIITIQIPYPILMKGHRDRKFS